ncbi:methyltransferase family protein [Methylosinus sp. sav-2]|jgi:SAM-dependent methyltransferase|uniref:methyltransferase domain-containing protein n=1 Tax=Methylosinus sp. sav-2 TaxID=2485168 RepID=UPI0004796BD0|nr:methyltransferase domain-containing protein [Methylosinus sp. sav-2]TDX62100.1 methyltransferase family protein [Methylosinus sp. sav-2]
MTVGFALCFAVAHEVADPDRFFREIAGALESGGLLLLAEPDGHASCRRFGALREAALACGLEQVVSPSIDGSQVALLRRTKNLS